MSIIETIKMRRSIRNFSNKKVPQIEIKKMIEAATYAPSASNLQAWRFIIVDNKDIIQNLIDAGAATFLKNTHQGILILYNNKTENIEYQDHIQSAAAAIQNLILAADSLKIGTCWVCHLPQKKELRKLFNIPQHYDPIAYIAFGYYIKKPDILERKNDIENIIFYNKFDRKEKLRSPLKLYAKRVLRKIYYTLPRRLRKKANLVADKFEKKF